MMFSQKRRNYRNWIWAAIACAAVTMVVVLLLGYLGRANDEPYAKTNSEKPVYDVDTDTDVDDDEIAADDGNDAASDEIEGVFQSYYLVKYDKDVIKIYFSDPSGQITVLEDTTIIYETLSETDQKRFEEGIRLDSRDELNKLLMDYES